MRVVFCGTPSEAVPTLERLSSSEHNLAVVVTQPDRPKGRGRHLTPPPAKIAAEKLGLAVFQPERINRPESVDRLRSEKPDVIVVVAFGQILKPAVLEIPRHGCMNVHFSVLPRYRGATPVEHALLNGETSTGLTVMLMDEGLDTGPILLQRECAIGPDENAGQLRGRLAHIGADLLLEALHGISAGDLSPRPQLGEPSFAPILDKSALSIDWSRPAREVVNRIRAFAPEPGAHCLFRGDRVRVLCATLRYEEGVDGHTGEVTAVEREGMLVAANQGAVLLTHLQPPGRRAMSGRDFANGFHVRAGDRFESESGEPLRD